MQNNEPRIGLDALEVMERNQVEYACVKGLECCGMLSWEQGDLKQLRLQAANNLKLLMPSVEQGSKILALKPTCLMMMKHDNPELMESADRDTARRLSKAV